MKATTSLLSCVVFVIVGVSCFKTTHVRNRLSANVVHLYEEICGTSRLCHQTNASGTSLPLRKCPWCTCEDTCKDFGGCCPDVHLNRCINTSIIFASSTEQHGFYMEDNCPENANRTLEEFCTRDVTTIESAFEEGPVYDVVDEKTYKNKFCAACNNVTNVANWDFTVKNCKYPNFDINLYSSLDSLHNGVRDYRCDMTYEQPTNVPASSCSLSYSISRCNVTGLWDKWNEEVNDACQNYDAPYLVFRNIFCYICNTGIPVSTVTIDDCSLKTDPIPEGKCMSQPRNDKISVFKNEYCRECNIMPGLSIDVGTRYKYFSHFNSSSDTPYDTSFSIFILDICKIRFSSFYASLRYSPTFDSLCEPFNFTSVPKDDHGSPDMTTSSHPSKFSVAKVNMSALFSKYKDFGGRSSWCGNDYILGQRTCSCAITCFNSGTCCPDMLLDPPVECSNNFSSTFSTMVTKCPSGYNDTVIIDLCERSSDDFGTIIDMTPLLSYHFNMEFKNVFCYICHKFSIGLSSGELSHQEYREMHLQCSKYVDVEDFVPLYTSFQDLLRLCKMEYFPHEQYPSDNCNQPIKTVTPILEPNNDNNTDDIMKDLMHMCLETGPYIFSRCKGKAVNIFCEMYNIIAQGGNQTHLRFPIYYFDCDSKGDIIFDPVSPVPGYGGGGVFYRYMFSLYDATRGEDDGSRDRSKNLHCTDGQYEDQVVGVCRDIQCSPGKLYRKGKCVTFLTWTSNLSYSIALKLRSLGNILDEQSMTRQMYLNRLALRMNTNINNTLYVRQYLMAKGNCMEVISDEKEIEVYVYLHIVHPNAVSRETLEYQLQQFTSSTLSSSFIVQNNSYTADHLPTVMESMYHGNCKFIKISKTFQPSAHVFRFDKFLFCSQVLLKDSEYELLGGGTGLKLKNQNKMLHYADFKFVSEGVRVCLEDYFVDPGEVSLLQEMSSIFLVTCIVISMVCLVLTIVAYSLLPKLRTLPGNNLMILAVFLLMAQLFLLIAFQDLSTSACSVIGCFIHYFWLGLFCCNSNCSFHMVRAFSFKSVSTASSADKLSTFRKSVLVILILPLLVVLAYNVIAYVVVEISPYPNRGCFIANWKLLVGFFAAPIVFLLLTNLVLFLMTLHYVRKVPKTQSNLQKRKLSIIFVKLFLITGGTWIFQLIDGFFPQSLFTVLVAVMNGSQGVFIFLSYTCNKTVYEGLRKLVVVKDKSELSHDTYETITSRVHSTDHPSPLIVHQTRL